MGLIRMMAALGLVLVFAIAACERASATNTTAGGAEADSVDSIAPAEVHNACVKTFNETMANPNAFLVDVRSADAFNKAHIPGAVQLSGDELLVALPEDKATPILLYCNSGRRSGAAANAVVGLGYTDVLNLEPGIKGWKAAGMPVA
eukprot:CAMPEP_0198464940 /NCGR_PEP_ID=MMETSP1456-20131121/2980_1 /TAXON_ID=1461544 ORGANISM="Unidentified sp., Strain RCC1871" /NCGR_SAMPLE_ID=MMETSP1456 /ASSEMBLY_ACC=CAM_ASM_001119 /LENGTH=146 /DNA_ID=CAMNT_0044190717 /DNA_START=266 /DNA_END=706 /DNA_ORIENTATION=-